MNSKTFFKKDDGNFKVLTTKELIEVCKAYPDNTLVCVYGYRSPEFALEIRPIKKNILGEEKELMLICPELKWVEI